MKIFEFLEKKAVAKLKKEIKAASGNEVFFRGIPNEEGIVTDIEVIARGNEYSVAAVLNRMKKNEIIIHNHPSGLLVPSDNDVQISSVYGELGGGSYIVNNEVNDIYVLVSLKKHIKIDIDKYFGDLGVIRKKYPDFEIRDEQYKMSKDIEKSLNENKKALIEAGTGTGKTLAYLIPTLEYALENNLKAIISTNTINLQEQLINKDIPLVKELIGQDFKYTLVKGRGNYLCKRKLQNAIMEESDDSEDKEILLNLQKWNETTKYGDRNELRYGISFEIWEKVNCELDLCTNVKCPYFSSCYFFNARKEIGKSDLLVLNHHMFFADLSIRSEIGFNTDYSILPNYDILIFDEAHNIEDTARSYFTSEVSKYSFGKLMGNIYNKRVRNYNKSGIFVRALIYLKDNLSEEEYEIIDKVKEEEIIENLNKYYDKIIEIFDRFLLGFSKNSEQMEIKKRFDKDYIKSSSLWKEIIKLRKESVHLYSIMIKGLTKLTNEIDKFRLEDENGIIFDFKKYIERVKVFMKDLLYILDSDQEDHVYWTNINLRKGSIRIYATPFEVADDLEHNLFNKMDRILFTSATLAVEQKFDYYKKNIGLEKKGIIEEIIDSPFDYEKQMRVYIPDDTKDPNSLEFFSDVYDFIKKLVINTEGRCFLLFTSYSSLNFIYNKIRGELEKKGYTLLKQGELPRHEMIELFKIRDKAILFGTDSFWEGIDVQGDSLKSVVIVKLPFKSPEDPVTEAIIEYMRKNNQNPFMNYQIPQAVIKFKQGVGRLIRSKTDTGIITILDNRVIKKAYGEKFLKSLPKTSIIRGNREYILKEEKRVKSEDLSQKDSDIHED